jgi:hypothetical protein
MGVLFTAALLISRLTGKMSGLKFKTSYSMFNPCGLASLPFPQDEILKIKNAAKAKVDIPAHIFILYDSLSFIVDRMDLMLPPN